MKLKIFNCQSKYAKAFRISICLFALASLLTVFCIDALSKEADDLFKELIFSVGFMMT